jgi:erythromycin esterase
MKKVISSALHLGILIIGAALSATAQKTTQTARDSAHVWVQQHASPVSINNYREFVQDIKPLFNSMAAAQVVGLGEGTHGTSEFQTVRAYITRYLCEEKGFAVICLENSYGWTLQLNKYIQTGEGNLDTLMKQNLLGMWQNEEIKELLQWMQQFNKTHKHKIQVAGIDHSETTTNARILQSTLNRLNSPALNALLDTLFTRASFMDAAYADMNAAKQIYKWKDILDNAIKAYELTRHIKAALDSMIPTVHSRLTEGEVKTIYTTLYNSELAYYSLYRPVKEQKEASRDEAMANMVKRISGDQHNAKVVVWAHNAHLAKQSIFGDDANGGGTGKYLLEYYPGNYFALGTGTAGGTFSSTTDRFIVSTSRFKSNALSNAITGSWEQVMQSVNNKTVFIDARDKKYQLPALPLRFTGYGKSSNKDFIISRINKLFDGFIFIPITQATHVRQ